MPAVSVLMPVHNGASTLVQAIRSVFAQTTTDWELLIGDDGSRDETPELLAAIEDPRVRVFTTREAIGSGAQRNRLAREARGEFFALLDADDVMAPRRLEEQVALLRAAPEVDLVASATFLLARDGEPLALTHDWPLEQEGFRAIRAGYLIHSSVTTRGAWALANPYDVTLLRSQDHDLWARTYPALRARRLREPLVFYRVGSQGSLRAHRRGWWASVRIYLRHGPSRVGWIATGALVLGTLGLLAISWIPALLDIEPAGFVRRRRPLDPNLRARAEELLRQAGEGRVPGWEDLP